MTRISRASERILFSEARIARGVNRLARDIAKARHKPEIAVPVLAGAFVFAADLLRALEKQGLSLETEFIWLRSYGKGEKAGNIQVLKAPTEIVRGRTVLLIDGVLDSGGTLRRASELLTKAGARAIVSAVAVVKDTPGSVFRADHAMFKAGQEFLYGYGMDRGEQARGLPDIRVKT